MKRILFVGGPNDGHRKQDPRTNPTTQTQILTYAFPPWRPEASFDKLFLGARIYTYEVKNFNGHEVAFHSDIKDPMEALIKGYKYHRNKKRVCCGGAHP